MIDEDKGKDNAFCLLRLAECVRKQTDGNGAAGVSGSSSRKGFCYIGRVVFGYHRGTAECRDLSVGVGHHLPALCVGRRAGQKGAVSVCD